MPPMPRTSKAMCHPSAPGEAEVRHERSNVPPPRTSEAKGGTSEAMCRTHHNFPAKPQTKTREEPSGLRGVARRRAPRPTKWEAPARSRELEVRSRDLLPTTRRAGKALLQKKGPRNFRSEARLRGQDLNLRPSGYEPDELPDCSTARQVGRNIVAARLLSRELHRQTVTAPRPDVFSRFSCSLRC